MSATVHAMAIGSMLSAFSAASAILGVDYVAWRRRRRTVERAFSRASTSFGTIPYLDLGLRDGPVVLLSPGGGAGPDLAYAFPWMVDAGFRVLSISRPGYYGVPIQPGQTLASHADLYAEVLASLQVGPVHVFGVSAGGPAALYYAARHPTRTLTLWSAVTGRYEPNRDAMDSPLGRLVLSPRGQAVLSWALSRAGRWFPRASMKAFLRTESDLTKGEIPAVIASTLASAAGLASFRALIDATTPMTELYPGMMDELEKMGRPWSPPWDRITMPVLAAASPIDKDVSADHLDSIRTHLPHAQIFEARAGGHFVWWGDDGKTLIDATLDHWNRCVPT